MKKKVKNLLLPKVPGNKFFSLVLLFILSSPLWGEDEALSGLYLDEAYRLYQTHHYQQSRSVLNQSREFAQNGNTYALSGYLHLIEMEESRAISDFKESLSGTDLTFWSRNDINRELLYLYYKHKDYVKGSQVFLSNKELLYEEPFWYYWGVQHLFLSGEREQALFYLEQALLRFPENLTFFPLLFKYGYGSMQRYSGLKKRLIFQDRLEEQDSFLQSLIRMIPYSKQTSLVEQLYKLIQGDISLDIRIRLASEGLLDAEKTAKIFLEQPATVDLMLMERFLKNVSLKTRENILAVLPQMNLWTRDRDRDGYVDEQWIVQDSDWIQDLDINQDGKWDKSVLWSNAHPKLITIREENFTLQVEYSQYPIVRSVHKDTVEGTKDFLYQDGRMEWPLIPLMENKEPIFISQGWSWPPFSEEPYYSYANVLKEKNADSYREWIFLQGNALILRESSSQNRPLQALFYFNEGKINYAMVDMDENKNLETSLSYEKGKLLYLNREMLDHRYYEDWKNGLIKSWDYNLDGHWDSISVRTAQGQEYDVIKVDSFEP